MPSGNCFDNNGTNVEWRDFKNDSCCMDAMIAFSEAVTLRAKGNKTVPIFLDNEELQACQQDFTQDHYEIRDCPYDELSQGPNICSNLSISDIEKILGINFQSLERVCSGITEENSTQNSNSTACYECLDIFKKASDFLISYMTPQGAKHSSPHSQTCDIALLISIAFSHIDDWEWVHSLSRCVADGEFLNIESGKKRSSFLPAPLEAIAAVIGLIAILVLLGVMFIHLRKRSKNRDVEKPAVSNSKHIEHGSRLIVFTYQEISNAMNYTSPCAFLGEGSTGKVYKGRLPSGQYIAIKHINKDIPKPGAFLTEVKNLSKIRHDNLVSLLGFCSENDEQYLIYEYCANGNLSQLLLGFNDKVLTWEQRVRIAYGSVLGLRFLHRHPDSCIVHRDIKPTNILLSENMETKLADFGLLRMFQIKETKVFTDVKGTIGYLDPEYASQGRLTCSSDIYSYGIVLLQLLSGRRAIELDNSNRETLVKKAQKISNANPINVSKFADPRLNGEYSREAFEIVLKLAVLCTASSAQGRPDVLHAVDEIHKALRISEGTLC